jgi:hypothetical protein
LLVQLGILSEYFLVTAEQLLKDRIRYGGTGGIDRRTRLIVALRCAPLQVSDIEIDQRPTAATTITRPADLQHSQAWVLGIAVL